MSDLPEPFDFEDFFDENETREMRRLIRCRLIFIVACVIGIPTLVMWWNW